MKKALILVDIQNDFCSGGSLAVKDGEKIIPLVNKLQEEFDIIVATIDFHPKNHKSFASVNKKEVGTLSELNGQLQVMWPDHCVQGTSGSELHPDLDTSKISKFFVKGINPEVDSYSGFFDNDKKSSTGMGEYLTSLGVTEVVVVGLALDYCVKATAIDAIEKFGFKPSVLISATRAVNIKESDAASAIEEMRSKGIICE